MDLTALGECVVSLSCIVTQTTSGLIIGALLFLVAAGLTLVFGVMDFINLAHGVQYMLGAYFAVAFYDLTGHFLLALVLALVAAAAGCGMQRYSADDPRPFGRTGKQPTGVEGNGVESLRAAMAAVSPNCGGCHQLYRGPAA